MQRYAACLLWAELLCLTGCSHMIAALQLPESRRFPQSRCNLARPVCPTIAHAAERRLTDAAPPPLLPSISRQNLFANVKSSLLVAASMGILQTIPASASAAAAAENSIAACIRPPNGGAANCVSTASVKQVDLFASPWTWSEGVSSDEVIGRLKGVIASDATLSLVEQDVPSSGNRNLYYCRVRAARNFCTDEIEFIVNPADRVVTFRSRQVEGPDNVSDFGANRKRLDDIRKRIGIVDVMGAEFASADAGPREGTVGQLRAFWGFQSGGGYESVLLDDMDD